MKTILDSADVAIISIDPQGVIQTFNTTAQRMLGYRAEEIGDEITWMNKEMVAHEMDFNGNPSDSGEEDLYLYLPIGKKISIIITKPGIYPYKCSWHGMFGVIEVRPGKE